MLSKQATEIIWQGKRGTYWRPCSLNKALPLYAGFHCTTRGCARGETRRALAFTILAMLLTEHYNIVPTLFRTVAALFQHCSAVLRS